MNGRLFGYVRVSVASNADANNLENQRRVLIDCEQVFEGVGSGASWNRPKLISLKPALQWGGYVKVAALDRLSQSLTEVLELLVWLRQNQVEVISLGESINQESAMGRAMLHLAIVFAEMERDLARGKRLRAGAGKGHRQSPRAAQGGQPEVCRGDSEHALARRPLLGPHRHGNRVALQQHPPDLHLEP